MRKAETKHASAGPLATGEVYSIGSSTWSPIYPMGSSRYYHAAAAVGSNLYVVGGAENASLCGISIIY